MKIAVVLFNLGGPDRPEAVQPFLFNLFNDPAIIGVPNPVRWMLAKFVSRRRASVAREIYGHIGGGSPILKLTEDQSSKLTTYLAGKVGKEHEVQCFIAMRYWHPRASQTVQDVVAYGPDKVVLAPLYPQYSTTTTRSSFEEWHKETRSAGANWLTAELCCFPIEVRFAAAHAQLIKAHIGDLDIAETRILFSAHGLPKRVVDRGDPYQWQVEQTVESVVKELNIPNLDWSVCFQSRVGPLEWIGPSTDDEIKRAASDKKGVVVVPIAFVSEHSETLVELDIEYRKLAEDLGVSAYTRVPALGVSDGFMDSLSELVVGLINKEGVHSASNGRLCPQSFAMCPFAS